MAPRSRAHLCFTMVEGSNRRREGGDVSRGFRVPRATDWQGPIGFFVASPFPTWRRIHFPSTLNSCRSSSRAFSLSAVIRAAVGIREPHAVILVTTGIQSPTPSFSSQRESGSPTPSFSSQRESGSPTPSFSSQRESGSPTPSFSSQRESRALVVCNEGCVEGKAQGAMTSSTRRIFVAMTVSAHSQGSGFPLRRERRGWVTRGSAVQMLLPWTFEIVSKGWSRARKEALIKGDREGLVELSKRSSGGAPSTGSG